MLLFPRLVGIITYCLFLFFFCILIYKFEKNYKFLLYCYLIVLCFLGYFFVPMSGSDLNGAIAVLHAYTNVDGKYLIENSFLNSSPFVGIYFHYIGILGDDHLLTAITPLIVFYFVFNIIIGSVEYYSVKPRYAFIGLFFIMSSSIFMGTIANIRTPIATSLVAFCVFKEVIQNTAFKNNIVLYLIACGMHVMGIFNAAITLVFNYFFQTKAIRKNLFAQCGFIVSIISFVYIFKDSYLQMAVDKGINYITSYYNGTDFVQSNSIIISYLKNIFILYMIFYVKKYATYLNFNDNKYLSFIKRLVIIDMTLFFVEFNVASRFGGFLNIIEIPLCYICISRLNFDRRKKIINIILFVCGLFLLNNVSRGDLCTYRFF